MDVEQKLAAWLAHDQIDDRTKAELRAIARNKDEVYDRFSKQLEFGTGGLRGIVGAGTNRMNLYTVRLATQAFANFLLGNNLGGRGVAITGDSRNMSPKFIKETAGVLIANDIAVYVYRRISPTPLLSFAVRHCQADGGVMITASHNPKEYNGYKAYNSDGFQLLPSDANAVSDIMEKLTLSDVKYIHNPEQSPLWHWIDEDVYQEYFKQLFELAPPSETKDTSLNILYTPLHGTGAEFVPRALQSAGFSRIDCVEEQCVIDGDFSTVVQPNPEEAEAFNLAFRQAKQNNYDLIIATDPDGDRVGVAVAVEDEFQLLTGNQVGILLADYLLQRLEPEERSNKVIVKTIVSTEMISSIAKKYGVEVRDTLTGFKYIGALIKELPKEGKEFLFGFEESCGYLAGSFVRDKDAVMASLLISQMGSYYKQLGLTLVKRLDELMEEHGHYLDRLQSYQFNSVSEAEKAQKVIEQLRTNGFDQIAGVPVKSFKDYYAGIALDLNSNNKTTLDFPNENVLQWETVDGDQITLRPSGTEPKMKLYLSTVALNQATAAEKLDKFSKACDQMINQGLNG